MKLLIGASSSKLFHLKEFAQNLHKQNIEESVNNECKNCVAKKKNKKIKLIVKKKKTTK